MADNVSPEVRRWTMAQVKSKGMKPEMQIRRLLHGLGYRYRLHRADLPGRPDLVFPARRKVVFVNGCFWHNHAGCKRVRIPDTNRDYWVAKLERNLERDKRNISLLEEKDWRVVVIWECQLRDMSATAHRLIEFLEDAKPDTAVGILPDRIPSDAEERAVSNTNARGWQNSLCRELKPRSTEGHRE